MPDTMLPMTRCCAQSMAGWQRSQTSQQAFGKQHGLQISRISSLTKATQWSNTGFAQTTDTSCSCSVFRDTGPGMSSLVWYSSRLAFW
jgi:hypothetical protein